MGKDGGYDEDVKIKSMKKSIWKFSLEIISYQKLFMPKGAKILTVQSQYNAPYIWAICNIEEREKEERKFEIFGTGNPYYENHFFGMGHNYIGTFQLDNGAFVWHLFELVEII